jgi:predicted negative regulator of RcsB-dependent stress response
MLGKNNTRWFLALALVVLGLRIGYKYYRSQHKPDYKTQMEDAAARQEALIERIKADQEAQRARGATAIAADSAALPADSALSAQ